MIDAYRLGRSGFDLEPSWPAASRGHSRLAGRAGRHPPGPAPAAATALNGLASPMFVARQAPDPGPRAAATTGRGLLKGPQGALQDGPGSAPAPSGRARAFKVSASQGTPHCDQSVSRDRRVGCNRRGGQRRIASAKVRPSRRPGPGLPKSRHLALEAGQIDLDPLPRRRSTSVSVRRAMRRFPRRLSASSPSAAHPEIKQAVKPDRRGGRAPTVGLTWGRAGVGPPRGRHPHHHARSAPDRARCPGIARVGRSPAHGDEDLPASDHRLQQPHRSEARCTGTRKTAVLPVAAPGILAQGPVPTAHACSVGLWPRAWVV